MDDMLPAEAASDQASRVILRILLCQQALIVVALTAVTASVPGLILATSLAWGGTIIMSIGFWWAFHYWLP